MQSRLNFIFTLLATGAILLCAYQVWSPGKIILDGSHDRLRNGIWLQHGWLGDDLWFERNDKENLRSYFRNISNVRRLAEQLQIHNIVDVFPHLCPTGTDGYIPGTDNSQTQLFLQEFQEFRVMPWVDGVRGVQAFPEKAEWRKNFAQSIADLMSRYPQFAGIHINIEPCRSGNDEYIAVLREVRKNMPQEKILSVAAYPPPTMWHPFPQVHWDKDYYRRVGQYADQMAVMMYDTAIRFGKVYQHVMKSWTRHILDWSGSSRVLLGVPTYKDDGVGYHFPEVENLANALQGIHAGLSNYQVLPENYQGIAIYCEWEMDDVEWQLLRKHLLKSAAANRER